MDKFNPFNFEGRIGRLQYFGFGVIWSVLIFFVAMVAAVGSDPATGSPNASGGFLMLGLTVVFFVATVSYGVRRLHDFDKSGWWYLLAFVPFAGFVMGLVLLLAPGTEGPNQYGSR